MAALKVSCGLVWQPERGTHELVIASCDLRSPLSLLVGHAVVSAVVRAVFFVLKSCRLERDVLRIRHTTCRIPHVPRSRAIMPPNDNFLRGCPPLLSQT